MRMKHAAVQVQTARTPSNHTSLSTSYKERKACLYPLFLLFTESLHSPPHNYSTIPLQFISGKGETLNNGNRISKVICSRSQNHSP